MPVKKQNDPNSKIALVIGGAGFIGSYLSESLLAQYIEVYSIDDLSSGKEEYIQKLKTDKKFHFIQADINQGIDNSLFPHLDYIFHMGGIESYINGHDLTINTMLVNSIGTFKSLELARTYPNVKYLLVSSIDIYNGVLSSLTLSNYYGVSDRDEKKYTHHEAKRYAEALLREYVNKYNLDGRVVRVSDVYGPRMDLESGNEIAQLVKETISGDTITVNGDGLKIIRPTYVLDVIYGICKAMFTEDTKGKIYNLVSSNEINILNLAYAIQKNSTKAIKIQFNQNYTEIKFPVHKVETQQTVQDLGWQPKTELAEGLTQTLEFYFLNNSQKAIKTTTDEANRVKVEKKEKAIIPSADQPVLQDNLTKQTTTLTTPRQEHPKKQVDEKKMKHPPIYMSLVLIAFSFFIILVLFVFPLGSLVLTTGDSFSKTTKNIEIYQQSGANTSLATQVQDAQTTIKLTLAQYDSLEWFFSLIRRRDNFESARSILNAAASLNDTLSYSQTDQVNTAALLQRVFANQADNQDIQDNLAAKTELIKEAETTRLDLQSEKGDNLLFNTQKQKTVQLVQSALPLTDAIKKSTAISSNVIKLLTPQAEKNYLLIFLDSRKPGYEGGKPLGFAALKTTSTGIASFTFNAAKDGQTNTIDQAINQAREYARLQKISKIDGVALLNTASQKQIISLIDNANLQSLATLVNAKNYTQKVEQAESSVQFEIWKELWSKLQSANLETQQQMGQAIVAAITTQNIKLVSVSSEGVYGLPLCETDFMLYNNFVDPYNQRQVDPQAVYCVNLSENQSSTNDSSKIKRAVTTSVQNASAKLTYSLTNNDNTDLNTTLQIMLPQAAKLTNVQLDFPISFDKVKVVRANRYSAYLVDVQLKPGETKNLLVEWTDDQLQSQPLNYLYIAKPYGVNLEKNDITASGIKNGTQQSKNSDAILLLKNK